MKMISDVASTYLALDMSIGNKKTKIAKSFILEEIIIDLISSLQMVQKRSFQGKEVISYFPLLLRIFFFKRSFSLEYNRCFL